jgi:hypothetical protein
MNDSENIEQPSRTPSPEVHREREVIVSNGGGRGSGASTAIVVMFALVALSILAFLAFTFLERDGNGIVPDEIDLNIEMPSTGSGS